MSEGGEDKRIKWYNKTCVGEINSLTTGSDESKGEGTRGEHSTQII